MAKEAERLLTDTSWLPEPLRLVELDGDAADGGDAGDGEALPDFLAGDGDEDEAIEAEDEHVVLVAAE
jgi:ParB family chromosome partitioning protein